MILVRMDRVMMKLALLSVQGYTGIPTIPICFVNASQEQHSGLHTNDYSLISRLVQGLSHSERGRDGPSM